MSERTVLTICFITGAITMAALRYGLGLSYGYIIAIGLVIATTMGAVMYQREKANER